MRESAELQDQVRRFSLGTSAASAPVSRAALTERVLSKLDGRCLVELAVDGGDLHAVVLRGDRVVHRRLGGLETVSKALDDLRFALKRLARPGGSAASRASARLVADDAVASLDRAVVPDGLRTNPPDEVIIVPPAELFPVPWAMLPTFAHRLVTVAPAARLWLDRLDVPRRVGGVVIVGGTGLPGAAGESLRIARLYGDVVRFTAKTSKVERVLGALDGAAIAHFVAHGSFRSDNPLFSSLQLADGGLTVYDLARVKRLPPVIVLSACNAGIVATRPGNETMGIVAGLLGAGVRTVIASTGLVPDTALTARAMVGFHRRLLGGMSPAEALAEVQTKAMARSDGFAAGSFVCFGAG